MGVPNKRQKETKMELSTFKAAIAKIHKGANIVMVWNRPVKTRKGVSDTITKNVRMIGRMGIEYDNINDVQEKRESGELPAENAGLPWGKWAIYPFLIEHTKKGETTPEYYARMYFGTSDKVKPQTNFVMNGKVVTMEEIAPLVLASEISEKTESDCFTVKVSNLIQVGSEVEYVEIPAEMIAKAQGWEFVTT